MHWSVPEMAATAAAHIIVDIKNFPVKEHTMISIGYLYNDGVGTDVYFSREGLKFVADDYWDDYDYDN